MLKKSKSRRRWRYRIFDGSLVDIHEFEDENKKEWQKKAKDKLQQV